MTSSSRAQDTCSGAANLVEFPVYVSPIAIIYNLRASTDLQLSPATQAPIFAQKITKWNDPAIAADNPDANLPEHGHHPVNRSDESGTTENFTDYLAQAAPSDWTYEVRRRLAGQGRRGRAGHLGRRRRDQDGKGTIGYADESQAGELGIAKIKVGDEFVAPTPEAAAKIFEASEKTRPGKNVFTFKLKRDARRTRASTRSSSSPTRWRAPSTTRPTRARSSGLPEVHRQPRGPGGRLQERRLGADQRHAALADPAGRRPRSRRAKERGRERCRNRYDEDAASAGRAAPAATVLRRPRDRRRGAILVTLAGVALFLMVKAWPALTASADELPGGEGLPPLHLAPRLRDPGGRRDRDPHRGAARGRRRAVHHPDRAPPARAAPVVSIDLLAAIPSVIYGLWGVAVLGPRSVGIQEWLADHVGWLPFFKGPATAPGARCWSPGSCWR